MFRISSKIFVPTLFLLLVMLIANSGCDSGNKSVDPVPVESDSSFYRVDVDIFNTLFNSDDPESLSVSIEIIRFDQLIDNQWPTIPVEYITDVAVRWGYFSKEEADSGGRYFFDLPRSALGDSIALNIQIDEGLVINRYIHILNQFEVDGIPEDRTLEAGEIIELDMIDSFDFRNCDVRFFDNTEEDETTLASESLTTDMNLYWYVPDIGLESIRIEVEHVMGFREIWPPLRDYIINVNWEIIGNYYIDIE
jgi:hypothetical protein